MIVACLLIALPVGWLLSPSGKQPAQAVAVGTSFNATTYLEPTAQPSFSSARGTPSDLESIRVVSMLGEVPRRTMEAIDYEGTLEEFKADVSVSVDDAALLLLVRATAPTAERAELTADTFADELIGYRIEENKAERRDITNQMSDVRREMQQLESELDLGEGGGTGNKSGGGGERSDDLNRYFGLQGEYDALVQQLSLLPPANEAGLDVLEPATAERAEGGGGITIQAPASRVSRVAIAGVIGLVLGAGISLLRERVNARVYDREQAEDVLGLPVLAEIPTIPRGRRTDVVAAAFPGTPASNAYQLLVAALQMGRTLHGRRLVAGGGGRRARTILVTSPSLSEGKSTTVANLAAAFAEIGKSVIVLGCDLRRPSVHQLFGVAESPGLADVLETSEKPELSQVLRPTSLERVHVVPPGVPRDPGTGPLSSPNMHELLAQAGAAADVVLLDTAPLLATSGWTQLIPEVDAVLVVVRAGVTTWTAGAQAARVLEMLEAPTVGVALNGVPASVVRRGGYRYPYAYRAPDDPSRAEPPIPAVDVVAAGASGNGHEHRSPDPSAGNGSASGAPKKPDVQGSPDPRRTDRGHQE